MEKRRRIFLSPPHMGGTEIQYVRQAFDSNWITTQGAHVDAFEGSLKDFLGVGHVAVLASGTAAIHLALILMGVTAGDEVIASTFTFSASVNPVVYQGALPVLVDSEDETWNMCPQLLEKAIEKRMALGRKPRAIILVHLYGMPAKMEEIMGIASHYGIPLIEDAAEALGSLYQGKPAGSFGDLGILSFNGNKIITTSGGGALLSDNADLIDRARFLATQAKDEAPHYQHSQIGYNYRMSNVLAGIGRGQMEVLPERIRQTRGNHCGYKQALKELPGLTFLEEPGPEYYSNHWLSCIVIDPVRSGTSREAVLSAMENEQIECRPLWKPMHLQPVFAHCPAFTNGVSESLFHNGLCLPSGSNLHDHERERVVDVLKGCWK